MSRPEAPRWWRLAVLAALVTALVGSVTLAVQAAPVRDDTPSPARSGWRTVFRDDFDGAAGSPASTANWFSDIGTGWGNQEKEQMVDSRANSYLDGDGHLILQANHDDRTWTSARLESVRDDFAAPPGGKMEMTASIQQPDPAHGLGYWPAFWSLGSAMRHGGTWPDAGEIDMMEDVNGRDESSQTLHTSAGMAGHDLVPCPATGSTCQTGYHTYSVIIDRTDVRNEKLQFLMDDQVERTLTEGQIGVKAWQAAIDPGFFIMLDLAMGGHYPDSRAGRMTPTRDTTSGGRMSVAYVTVLEMGPS